MTSGKSHVLTGNVFVRVADASDGCQPAGEGGAMLETIAVVLLVLWALGLISSYTMGGFIHALLVIALVVIVIRVLQGRRALG